MLCNTRVHQYNEAAFAVCGIIGIIKGNFLDGLTIKISNFRLDTKTVQKEVILICNASAHPETQKISYLFLPRVKNPRFLGSSDRGASTDDGSVDARPGD